MRKGYRVLAVCTATLVASMLFGTARSALLINGAGATFPYPIYSKWFDEYTKVDSSVHFNYQSIGSGGGITMLKNQTVDFGASDAPMNDEQLKQSPSPVLHFPSVMGAVVLAYSLADVKQKIHLTGPVIADIFLGNILKWSDPKIAQLNPGVNLPNDPIVTGHRSDGSGTTYIFADYLSKVSPEWAKKVGKGTSLKWPVGLGAKGNEGVTGLVQQTPGAIGYVELIYALKNNIPFAIIKNHDGNWIEASLGGVTAAAAGAASNMPDDFRVSITDAPGADSYPISSFTWLLIYKNQTDKVKGQAIVKFLNWALSDGQQYAARLDYAPLPPAVIQKERQQISQILEPNNKKIMRMEIRSQMKIGLSRSLLRAVMLAAGFLVPGLAGCSFQNPLASYGPEPRVEDCMLLQQATPAKFVCNGKTYTAVQLTDIRNGTTPASAAK